MRFPPLKHAVSLLLLFGCEQSETVATSAPPDVAATTFSHAMKEGAVLVDVRTPEEFAAGHLPHAINVPVDEITAHFDELPSPEVPVAVYCATGVRSKEAARFLVEWGHERVYDLGGQEDRIAHHRGVKLSARPHTACLE